MEETRTQIRFSSPDIDGSTKPQLLTLEQETPIEGTSEKEDGTKFVWHKWLCVGSKYFMASTALDGMLKMIPEKVGKVIKIEKVENPKGGFPFFQINGMNRDQLIAQANIELKLDANTEPELDIMEATMPQTISTQPATTDSAIDRIEQKLDRIIIILDNMPKGMPL